MKLRTIKCDVYRVDPVSVDGEWEWYNGDYVKSIVVSEEDDDCKAMMDVLLKNELIYPHEKNRTNIKMNQDEHYIYIEVFEKKKSRPLLVIREEIDNFLI